MIARAGPADAAFMAQILGGWIGATDWMSKLHTPAQDLWFCDHLIEKTQVFVIRMPEVRGFLARQGHEVPALYLAHDARGQGLGKALLDRAKQDRAKQDRAKQDRDRLELWTFQANPRAIRFYRREGFTEDHRTTGAGNDESLPDMRLIWTRKPAP